MSEVTMPRLSDTMEEGELARWLVKVGDTVSKGDVIAEIETDKATMDLEAFEAGVLEELLVEEGTMVPIGQAVAMIGDGSKKAAEPDEGSAPKQKKSDSKAESKTKTKTKTKTKPDSESTPDDEVEAESEAEPTPEAEPAEEAESEQSDAADAADAADEPTEAASEEPAEGSSDETPDDGPGATLRMSPLARKLAHENDIDLDSLSGSGPGGRIIRADIDDAIAGKSSADSQPAPAASASKGSGSGDKDSESVPLNRVRKVTAKRLVESQAVPHFFLTSVVDVERLVSLRAEVNEGLAEEGLKVSLNDFIIKAVAIALRQHPEANASFDGDAILRHGRVNVGVAVATEAGLLVPVVKDADSKTLTQIGSEVVALAGRAREGKLSLDEMSGGTFSVSNLGMFGIDSFTAMLNPPEAGILAVGAASAVPVLRDGQLVEVPKMTITLTVDHRAMDGATGAAFLRDLTAILERPLRIVV